MRQEMFLSLALLFITSGAFTNAQNSAPETLVSARLGAPLTVECPLRVEQPAVWKLNGSDVPRDMRPEPEQAAAGAGAGAGEARLVARLHAAAARAHHAGLYTCSREPAARRVRVTLAAAPPQAAPSPAQPDQPAQPERTAGTGEDEARGFAEVATTLVYYDINRNLSLDCTFPNAAKTLTYLWKKNDKAINEVPELKERFKLEENNAVFSIKGRSNEEDYGNYTCALGDQLRAWEVRGRPVARLPDNSNVVEGQKLKLQCKVVGKPYPRVSWTYAESEESNASTPITNESDRFRLEPNEQGVADAALVLEAAARTDAGVYSCRAGAVGAAGGAGEDRTVLRVKDMYAALWPFLGIVAEVAVLCGIIIVYEHRRRTKPELDDSDTDNHDQKKS